MYNTRSSAKNRSGNTGKTSYLFNKPAGPKKQTKVKKGSQHLGAVKYKILQEGISKGNFALRRLTVSPSFFTKGLKSKVVQKQTRGHGNLNDEHIKILNEDLYGLLQPAEELISLNTQIKENKEPYNPENPEVSNYLLNLFNNYKSKSKTSDSNNSKSIFNFSKVIAKTNCNNNNLSQVENYKSLFKEINQKYDQLLPKKSLPEPERDSRSARLEHKQFPKINYIDPFINNINADFCQRLREQIKIPQESAKKKSIFRIHTILRQLLNFGNPFPIKMTENRHNKQPLEENDEHMCLQLVPPSSWVFRTPNDQKLKQAPVVDEVMIDLKPAILHTNDDMKVLYEIDETAAKYVNFENYAEQKRMVPINPNIARPVCEVNVNEEAIDEKFIHCRNKENWQEFLKQSGMSHSNANDSFKIPTSKHRALRDSTNLVREVIDPKRHGLLKYGENCALSSGISPYKKESRVYTQRPMKTIKKSSRSFKKPPKKLTFDFESKRQKLSLFETSIHEKTEIFNLDESQEAFNESFTFIKNDNVVDMECTLTENYFSKNEVLSTTTTTNELSLNIVDVDMDCYGASTTQNANENEKYTNYGVSSNLCDLEVSYNLNEHFLRNFPKITETPTLKFYPRRSYGME